MTPPGNPQTDLDSPAGAPARGRFRRVAPVLALLVLAPFAAECSWGGFTVVDFPLVVAFLGPLYGGAAVLIRETARRTGRGWPTIVLLAAAFGVVQAGLVDQSLFNPGFLDDTEFAGDRAVADRTRVPVLDVSVQQAFSFLGNHVALSICAPIAIVESFVSPDRRHRPWLRWPGLLVVGALYLLGSLLIFADDTDGRKGFQLGTVQLAVAVLVTLALVVAALLPRWRRDHDQGDHDQRDHDRRDRRRSVPAPGPVGRAVAPGPWLVTLLGYALHLTADLVPGWPGVALRTVFTGVVVALVVRWSRRPGWEQRHVLAGWSAGVVAAATFAYLVPPYKPAPPALALLSDVAVSVVVAAVVLGAYLRLRSTRPRSTRLRPAAGSPP
ncbi:hypothetical protein [Micromonospora rosaria]|uniref:hypothetical protein n=1 Tax=Micromonospora rosaria TaxID=47874 RepID=UPI000A8A136D|nr:hypothetical protein [Micromonospora rosaria]